MESSILKNQFNKNGDRHGYWEKYYNDKLYYKGNYINGTSIGYWENYHLNGDLYYIVYYLVD